MTTRRTFLKVGVAGSVMLTVAGTARWALARDDAPRASAGQALTAADRQVLGAIIPAMLAGTAGARDVGAVLGSIDKAVAGFPPHLQAEVRQLLDLLDFPLARRWLAGIAAPWPEAPVTEVAAFLQRWRTSRFELLQQAYQALHDLVIGAWYARPDAWPAIGYPGPPAI